MKKTCDIVNIISRNMWVAFGTAFMLCLFAPLEIYMSNKGFFFFDGKEILGFAIIAMVVCAFTILALLFITFILSEKCYKWVLAIGFAVSLVLYIQGNFLPNEYGSLDGTAIDWSLYKAQGIISVVVALVIILTFGVLAAKASRKTIEKTTKIGSIYMLLIQILTLIYICWQGGGLSKEPMYLSTSDGQMQYGVEENFVILMLDTFESTALTDVLNEDEARYGGMLDDFTYYPNTSGMYRSTVFALPYLIGGVEYHNDSTYEEYLIDTYEESKLLNKLQEQNWNIGIYNSNRIPNSDIALIADNCVQTKLEVSSHRKLAEYMYRLVGFRYMPQPLKQPFWFYADDINTDLKEAERGIELYSDNNFEFAARLSDISCVEGKRTFHLYELFGAHPPYNITVDFTRDDSGTGKEDTTKGLIKMISMYSSALKQAGIYDNTTIIVMGDHGKELLWNPVFMIKPAGTKHDFEIDDTAFSYQELQEIYSSIISGADEQDIKKVIESHSEDKRRYLKYEHNDGLNSEDYFTADIYECEVIKRADEEDALGYTGLIYSIEK